MLDDFEGVLNGLLRRRNTDIYVTGSNAKFLSRDVITEFSGRGDEIHLNPLSFSELMSCYSGNKYDGWNEYVQFGGLPPVVLQKSIDSKMKLLGDLNKETYYIEYLIDAFVIEKTPIMENVIFNELRIRGYNVDAGCSEKRAGAEVSAENR